MFQKVEKSKKNHSFFPKKAGKLLMVHHQIFLSVWDAESGNLVKTIKFEEEIQGTIKVKSRPGTIIWT